MEQKKWRSLYIPILFAILLWCIKLLEASLDEKWYVYGLQPQSLKGLMGIVTAPLLHGSFSHLASNTFPLIVLGSAIFYLYRKIAFNICLYIYVFTGLFVWLFSSNTSYHIGASGLVYGFAFFLFFSGIIRKHKALMATSLLIAFLYGGMVWGVLPGRPGMSWESHLMGAFCGTALSFFYKDVKMKIEEVAIENTFESIFSKRSLSEYYDHCNYIFIPEKKKLKDSEEFSAD